MMSLSLESKRKDGRKLRANVVRSVARDPAKQRQQPRASIRTRSVVTLFVSKRDPLVPFVLNVAGEQVATSTTQTEAPCIARFRLIETVVDESSPTGVSSFRIGVEQPRQRKPELNKATLRTDWSLRRDDRNTVVEAESDR